MYMPIGLFGISIATAALPNISGHAAVNNDAGVRQSVSSGLRLMLMLNVPATAGLAALATPIVRVIYEHGRFTPLDTAATASALMCYAPGLVGYSAVKLISPAFYALGSSRIPVIASAASVVVNVAINLVLVRTLGHRGLALGTAIAALCNGAILFVLLRARLRGLEGGRIFTAMWKILLASTVMAAAAYETERWLHVPLPGDAVIVQAARVFGAIVSGLVVLALCAQLLRIREFTESLRAVVRSA
jgi:putative peptidoglycan lipid II flippase